MLWTREVWIRADHGNGMLFFATSSCSLDPFCCFATTQDGTGDEQQGAPDRVGGQTWKPDGSYKSMPNGSEREALKRTQPQQSADARRRARPDAERAARARRAEDRADRSRARRRAPPRGVLLACSC
jgi:hypothetical protein